MFLLLLFLILPQFHSFGQKKITSRYLVAVKRSTKQTYVVSYSSKVKVTLANEYRIYKGRLIVNSDSTVVISGTEIHVNNIGTIGVSKLVPKIAGGLIIGAGTAGVIIGLVLKNYSNNFTYNSSSYNAYQYAGSIYMLGGLSTAALGILITSTKRNYNLNKYQFAIVKA